MKRFVTYLYEYERGNKSKNAGFIRVNVQKDKTVMEVCVRNYSRGNGVGKVFALFYKDRLSGILLDEIKVIESQGDGRISFQTENIMDSGYSGNEIVGVGIQFEGEGYIASCWRDAYADEIARYEFSETEKLSKERDIIEGEPTLAVAEDWQDLQEQQMDVELPAYYEKIDMNHIRNLPSPNWHLTTNSFLVHGFWNYGYLVLKKEMEGNKEKLSLGVPGIFEKPEAVMAILFGFPTFAEIPTKVVEASLNQTIEFPQKEKNQEPKVGTFGCWFVELKN